MTSGIQMGNVYGTYVIQATLTPTSVSATTTSTQTFTVVGLKTTDMVNVCPPSQTANVTLAASRVSAADTLSLTFINPTAGALTPAAGVYFIEVIRPESNLAKTSIGD